MSLKAFLIYHMVAGAVALIGGTWRLSSFDSLAFTRRMYAFVVVVDVAVGVWALALYGEHIK